MSQLVVDIGNSRAKLAIFKGSALVESATYPELTQEALIQVLEKNDVQYSIMSSVSDGISGLEEILTARSHYIRFTAETTKGIKNNYKSPRTLGLDRLAGLFGAQTIFPGEDCLVVDAGTCITYDLIDKNSIYSGGSISPGIRMRLKAMNAFTGRLPLVKPAQFEGLYGGDTAESMLSGVINGAWFELLGFITAYVEKYPRLKVLLCGGDGPVFDRRLKNSIFAGIFALEEHLVLIGLNEVIRRNDKIN